MTTDEVFGSEEHRARLKPILEQLDAANKSVFIDLCELVIMLSECTDGMIKFEHQRVVVHIKAKKKAKKV